MACRLLKLRVTGMAVLLSRRGSLAPLNSSSKGFALETSWQWSLYAVVRCMSTMESSSVSSMGLSPLERLRQRQMRDAAKMARLSLPKPESRERKEDAVKFVGFGDLGLSDKVMEAAKELGLTEPTEVQAVGIPVVLAGENVALASHTGSGKTLAYMLPIALRRDEVASCKFTKARKPRAVVLCPMRELIEQVLQVAKSLCYHARFRAAMVGGGSRMKTQEDSLNRPIDLIVATQEGS